jgi:hypothetical protein
MPYVSCWFVMFMFVYALLQLHQTKVSSSVHVLQFPGLLYLLGWGRGEFFQFT